jgi:hypothetical protein
VQFADHFAWHTYGEVDTRRKNLGSAIQGLFNSGEARAADGLETIALWSMNIPGDCGFSILVITDACGYAEYSRDLTFCGKI